MNKLGSLGMILLFSIVSVSAAAANFDGSQPLLCTSVETYDCEPGGNCIRGLADDINAPEFIFLDFKKSIARTTKASGEERTVKIGTTTQDNGSLILNGVQLGLGWSLAIEQETGHMTLTIAGNEVAIVVFGACTPV